MDAKTAPQGVTIDREFTIQALVDRELFQRFDYLSTVSGGGYIGAWLSAWLSYSKDAGAVVKRLGSWRNNPDAETMPLLHLRRYSSFLTPVVGVFSADTWTAIAIVLRNILVNWLILIPALITVIAAVKLLALALAWPLSSSSDSVPVVISIICLVSSALGLGHKLSQLYASKPVECAATAQTRFLWWSLTPAIVAGICFVWLVRHGKTPGEIIASALERVGMGDWHQSFWALVMFAAAVYMSALLVGWLRFVIARACLLRCQPQLDAIDKPKFKFKGLDCICWLAGVSVFALLLWIGIRLAADILALNTYTPDRPIDSCHSRILFELTGESLADSRGALPVILGVAWFLFATIAAHSIYLLLRSSSRRGDVEREWLGRASGWHLIAGIAWMALTGIVLLGPDAYCTVTGNRAQILAALTTVSGVVTWFLGKSSATPAQGQSSSRGALIGNIVLAVSGPLFAVLLILVLSLFVDLAWGQKFKDWIGQDWLYLAVVFAGALTVMLLADRLANINAFSLHALYRNRLVRAFLGGGRAPHRTPDGFTDFDWDDDMRVSNLWSSEAPEGTHWRLFHVINMTLNLSATDNLAWQQRKAMPFTATPFHCGNADLGYRPSTEYGGEPAREPVPTSGGMSVGTAIAISGAAISSNMGYHSSKSLSFLLGFLNVRLGCWLGNPGRCGVNSYRREAPRFALFAFLTELFGLVSDKSRFVYLSDGGHFENLGLYEMVRRPCRYIVVVDGAQDAKRGYEDLGNAVRKIWIDLGVRIRFVDAPLLAADETTKLAEIPYFAVGTVEYLNDQKREGEVSIGKIFYIKPVVRGDEEAADVIAYKRAHIAFPQQSTADQWFDEPQLEAYRRLGYLMMQRTIEPFAPRNANLAGLNEFFDGLTRVNAKTLTI